MGAVDLALRIVAVLYVWAVGYLVWRTVALRSMAMRVAGECHPRWAWTAVCVLLCIAALVVPLWLWLMFREYDRKSWDELADVEYISSLLQEVGEADESELAEM